jgi:hypothetical protein
VRWNILSGMVGGRQVVLMALPAVAALLYVLVRRPVPPGPAFRLRGLWLVAAALGLHIVRFELLSPHIASGTGVGRVHGLLTLACAGGFLALNRATVTARSRTARAGVVASVAGVAANALPVILVGAMPVLRAAALSAGFTPAELATAPPGYVVALDSGVPVVWLGDVLPVPGGLTVLSLGDLLLFAGLAILIGLALASRVGSRPATAVAPVGASIIREVEST